MAHPHLIWNRPQHNYLSPIEVDIHASGRTLQYGVERKNILHRDKHTSKTNGYIVYTECYADKNDPKIIRDLAVIL